MARWESVVVLYSAADLIWATRIKATADSISIPCRPVRSLDMLQARLADSDVRGLIVDLDAPEIGLALIAALREAFATATPGQRPQIIAFGPHVALDLFERARRAGADKVLARGAFDRNLPDILKALHAAGGSAQA